MQFALPVHLGEQLLVALLVGVAVLVLAVLLVYHCEQLLITLLVALGGHAALLDVYTELLIHAAARAELLDSAIVRLLALHRQVRVVLLQVFVQAP